MKDMLQKASIRPESKPRCTVCNDSGYISVAENGVIGTKQCVFCTGKKGNE